MKSTVLLEAYCKELRLPAVLREYPEVARQCAQNNREYAGFLQDILELEVQSRSEKVSFFGLWSYNGGIVSRSAVVMPRLPIPRISAELPCECLNMDFPFDPDNS